MAQFRDATGRPGPSTWELGTYPDGQDDWPGERRELVRSRGVRRIRRQAPADGLPLVSGRRRDRHLFRRPAVQQLRRQGTAAGRRIGQPRAVRHLTTWPATSRSGCGTRAATGAASCSAAPGSKRAHAFHDEDARAPFDARRRLRLPLHAARRAPLDDAAADAAPIVTLERDPAELVPVGDEVFRRTAALRLRPAAARRPRRGARRDQPALDHRAGRRSRRRTADERAADAAVAAATGRPPYQVGGLLSRLRCGADAVEPRRLHAVAAVPPAQRPRRGVSHLPADLRAAPPVDRRTTSCARSASSAARMCAAPSTTWRRDPTSTRPRSRSTASASARSSRRSISRSSRGCGPACSSRAGSRRGRCRPRAIR